MVIRKCELENRRHNCWVWWIHERRDGWRWRVPPEDKE